MKFDVCPHFGVCGGCSSQDMSYSDQLKKKTQWVQDCLAEIDHPELLPILPSPDIQFYRNKMEFSFGDSRDIAILNLPPIPNNLTKREKRKARLEQKEKSKEVTQAALLDLEVHLGLHPRKRFNLVTPTPSCGLLSKESQQITAIVAGWATQNQIPSYTRHNNEGVLRHLVIREGKNTGERMVNLFTTSSCQKVEALAEKLKEGAPTVTTFIWTQHDGLGDSTTSGDQKVFWGNAMIEEKVDCVRLRVPPRSFMQTNTHAAEKMIQTLRDWMKADDKSVLMDLYCGAGTIGLNMAADFKQVVGIESDEKAIIEAKENATLNNLLNASFKAGRVEDLLTIFDEVGKIDNQVVVVDPPRAGLHTKVVESLVKSHHEILYYVSCNPISLGRDLKGLSQSYKVEKIQPMDFFPHTDHVETLVKLFKTV